MERKSNLANSYGDYIKDITLAKYTADTVGKYINEASQNHIQAINELGQKVGIGLNILSHQLKEIHAELNFLNKKLDIQIEQQKITNNLLENIGSLLRVPDSEKERQRSIELGLKFFLNAQKDEDFFTDSLAEFLKAEGLMKQDYFVLHRIGLIYLYSFKNLDPQKALDYFTRAAKYASVENDPKAAELAIFLTKKSNNSEVLNGVNAMQILTADSYEKAAFAAYVLGNFELAVKLQTKASENNITTENLFILAKYQARANQIYACLQNLSRAIDEIPSMALAIFKDLDLINELGVLTLIELKNDNINKSINQLKQEWEAIHSDLAERIINELNELLNAPYDKKIKRFKEISKLKSTTESEIKDLEKAIRELKDCLINSSFLTFKDNKISLLLKELQESTNQSLEIRKTTYEDVSKQYENDRLKIGSIYSGGIVFYIDKTGKHGLVGAEKDQGKTLFWGTIKFLGTKTYLGSGKANTKLIIERSNWATGFLLKKTAAKICTELSLNGYNDWFLPSKDELNLVLKTTKVGRTYWSSSENKLLVSICSKFLGESVSTRKTHNDIYVRAVRAF